MQDRPGKPENADKDDEVHPGKTAPDFGSLELDRRQFHRNGNPEYFRVSFQRQSVSCNSFNDSARLFVEALYLGLMYRELVLENCDGSAGASPYRCRVTLPPHIQW
jgi:hypothetical protein